MQNTILTLCERMRGARDAQGQRLYDDREIRSITDLLLDEVCGVSRTTRILHPDLALPEVGRARLLQIAAQLSQGIPVQQALGYEWFCDARFKVTPDVLIPRPETAELVHWIASRPPLSPAPRILDVGTGSGCIALSLARLIHNSQVLALDLSTAALDVAVHNACQQGVDNVQFAQCDILAIVDNSVESVVFHDLFTTCPQVDNHVCPQGLSTACPHLPAGCPQPSTGCPQPLTEGPQPLTGCRHTVDIASWQYDIIVSNPPYICQRESAAMSDIVLRHEPGTALFVPDDDPLLFYRAIARYALRHLSVQGELYFEINAAYGAETCQLLHDFGFADVELRQDITGRDRMIRARISS